MWGYVAAIVQQTSQERTQNLFIRSICYLIPLSDELLQGLLPRWLADCLFPTCRIRIKHNDKPQHWNHWWFKWITPTLTLQCNILPWIQLTETIYPKTLADQALTPYGIVRPWWLWFPSRTTFAATLQKQNWDILWNTAKSLRCPPEKCHRSKPGMCFCQVGVYFERNNIQRIQSTSTWIPGPEVSTRTKYQIFYWSVVLMLHLTVTAVVWSLHWDSMMCECATHDSANRSLEEFINVSTETKARMQWCFLGGRRFC